MVSASRAPGSRRVGSCIGWGRAMGVSWRIQQVEVLTMEHDGEANHWRQPRTSCTLPRPRRESSTAERQTAQSINWIVNIRPLTFHFSLHAHSCLPRSGADTVPLSRISRWAHSYRAPIVLYQFTMGIGDALLLAANSLTQTSGRRATTSYAPHHRQHHVLGTGLTDTHIGVASTSPSEPRAGMPMLESGNLFHRGNPKITDPDSVLDLLSQQRRVVAVNPAKHGSRPYDYLKDGSPVSLFSSGPTHKPSILLRIV